MTVRAIIYGKNDCPHCSLAKNLLETYHMGYIFKNIDQQVEHRNELKEFFETNSNVKKTVPQIFFDGEYLGGYSELVKYIEECIGGYGEGKF